MKKPRKVSFSFIGWLWPAIFLNLILLLCFLFFFLLFLLKILCWQVELFGISPYVLEGGVQPYSMLEVGEKLHGGPVYQIWMDELAKPSVIEKKKENSFSEEAVPYMMYKTEPNEIKEYYNRVMEIYLNAPSEEELENRVYKTLEEYMQTPKKGPGGSYWDEHNPLKIYPNYLNPTEITSSGDEKLVGKRWTDLVAPDVDVSSWTRLKELIEMRNSFLLKMNLKEFDFSKEEREIFLKESLLRLAQDKGFLDRLKKGENWVSEGGRFVYHWVRIYDYWIKSKYFPVFLIALPDGPVRWRGSSYYDRGEYWSSWRHFRSTDRPLVYVYYGLPRRTPILFFDFYRYSWLKRDLVHVSNYQELLRDFHRKVRYRVLDYYLERAERKYFYRLNRSIPDLFRYSQKQKFRRRRRLTWLRRSKRYLMGEFTTLYKIKPYMYLIKRKPDLRGVDEEEAEELNEDLKFRIFGKRRKYKRRKFRVYDDQEHHYRVAPSKRAYPRFYYDDLKNTMLMKPEDTRYYNLIRRRWLVNYIYFALRNEAYNDYSFYEKWMFMLCLNFRTRGKDKRTPHFPIFWLDQPSAQERSFYYLKNYLPSPFWFYFPVLRKPVRNFYKESSLLSKSYHRDSWFAIPIKRFSEEEERRKMLYGPSSFLKDSEYLKPWFQKMGNTFGFRKYHRERFRLLKRLKSYGQWKKNGWSEYVSHMPNHYSPVVEYEEPEKEVRGWLTGFRIPKYKDLTFQWLVYYTWKGVWIENHFGTYLAVLFSGWLYWLALLGKTIFSTFFFWFFWVFLLVSTFFFLLWLVRHRETICNEMLWWKGNDWFQEVNEEEFIYWFFKTFYRDPTSGFEWTSISKTWRFSNFYLLDKFYYRVYGKSLYHFQKLYAEEEKKEYMSFVYALIRFVFFLMVLNLIIGVSFLIFFCFFVSFV